MKGERTQDPEGFHDYVAANRDRWFGSGGCCAGAARGPRRAAWNSACGCASGEWITVVSRLVGLGCRRVAESPKWLGHFGDSWGGVDRPRVPVRGSGAYAA
ncbi:hypothetical protein GCM10023205_02840 [Yinghuangia aomiensis]|uniref:Uncharacterized protein n=1 Tax=Yinghuangia aomiensis TaxID=676205 RepID=A0ABP9GNZ3_9ACTN